jgi:hypothetical protein
VPFAFLESFAQGLIFRRGGRGMNEGCGERGESLKFEDDHLRPFLKVKCFW